MPVGETETAEPCRPPCCEDPALPETWVEVFALSLDGLLPGLPPSPLHPNANERALLAEPERMDGGRGTRNA